MSLGPNHIQRDEVVVRLREDIDIEPILGVHYWRKFLKPNALRREHIDRVSHIFEFNYRRKGDPAERKEFEYFIAL